MINIYTSYFYQIRNFKPNMIPVSTCMRDPAWYRPPENKEYYLDKRGVICGLRYEPLIVQKHGQHQCIGDSQICPYVYNGLLNKTYHCKVLNEYEYLLHSFVDKERTLKAFEYCCNKFNADTIVLIVYEAPNNPCSERQALQKYFNCEELRYPIC